MNRSITAALLVLTGACAGAAPRQPGADTTAAAAAPAVAGTWIHRTMPVTYLETMTLRTSGEAVSGEGTYMMEGGRRGTTAIAGTYRGGTLTLGITRDSGVGETFTGRVDAPDHVTGTLRVADGDPQSFDLARQPAQ